MVDTMGLIISVVVSAASMQDRDGAKLVLQKIKDTIQRLCLIWADGAYAGELIDWVKDKCGWKLEIQRGPKGAKGFAVRPWLWIVERTFAWLGRYRRLSKDYEYLIETAEGFASPKHRERGDDLYRNDSSYGSAFGLMEKTGCNYTTRGFSNTL